MGYKAALHRLWRVEAHLSSGCRRLHGPLWKKCVLPSRSRAKNLFLLHLSMVSASFCPFTGGSSIWINSSSVGTSSSGCSSAASSAACSKPSAQFSSSFRFFLLSSGLVLGLLLLLLGLFPLSCLLPLSLPPLPLFSLPFKGVV